MSTVQNDDERAPAARNDFRRAAVRKRGLEALVAIVAAIDANTDDIQTHYLVRFLMACYNRFEYRFPLTDLRDISDELVDACLAYLALDALDEELLQHRIEGGAAKLERWVEDYGPPLTQKTEIDPEQPWRARLVDVESEPRERDITATFEIIDETGADRVVNLAIDKQSSFVLRERIVQLNIDAWRDDGPCDRAPGEQPPKWILG